MSENGLPKCLWVDGLFHKMIADKRTRDEAARRSAEAAQRIQSARRALWDHAVVPGLRAAVERFNVHLPQTASMELDNSDSDAPAIRVQVKVGDAITSALLEANLVEAEISAEYSWKDPHAATPQSERKDFTFSGGAGQNLTIEGHGDADSIAEILLRPCLHHLRP
jgi:hypothetical protein